MKKKFILLFICLVSIITLKGQSHNGGGTGSGVDGSMVIQVLLNGNLAGGQEEDWTFLLYFTYTAMDMPMFDASIGNVDKDGNSTPDLISFVSIDETGDLYVNVNLQDYSGMIGLNPALFNLSVTVTNTVYGVSKTEEYPAGTYSIAGGLLGTIDIACPACPGNTPTGPTLAVNSIEAGCWSDGGTFDLTLAKGSVSPSDATVEYYSDDAGTMVIADPTKVVMTMANPSTPSEVKKYYARAISADGLEQSDIQEISVTFFQKPEASLALSDLTTTVCYNVPITLQTTNVNGFTPGTYRYVSKDASLDATGGDTYSVTSTVSTTYSVYVTSGLSVGACKDTASVDITVTPSISAGDIHIAMNPDKSKICAGESLELTASVSGSYTGNITYQWGTTVNTADRANQIITVSPSATTPYTVDVQLDGCPASGGGASQIIEVNLLPTLSVNNPAAVCGGTVDITQSGTGTYLYYTDATLAIPVANASAVAAGDYYVTLTDANGCTSKAEKVTATVNTPPTPQILVNGTAPTGDDLCAGTEITLACDNTGYATYTWSGGTATANLYERKATISAESANTFDLTVVDGNGCPGTASQVVINGKAAPTVAVEPVADACKGSEVTLAATPSWVTGEQTVLWEGNNLTDAGKVSTIATLDGGDNKYGLTLTDQNGCQVTTSVTVKGNEIKATGLTINPTSVKAGSSVNLGITAEWNGTAINDGVSYLWKKTIPAPASIIAMSKTTTDTPDANSTYEVVVEKGGCKDSVSGNVAVETDPFKLTGIDGYRAVCAGEDLSANPVKLYVTASGGQKNYIYTWTVPDGMTVESTNTDTLKITAIDYAAILPGGGGVTVKVDVSDASMPVNTGSKSVNFEVKELPQIKINDKENGATIAACKDVPLSLTAVATGATYSWESGESGATISAATNTVGTSKYTVTATYAGCSNQASVDVQVNELPEINLTATLGGTNVAQVCPDAEITLTATVPGVDAPVLVWGKGANGFTGSAPTTNVSAETTYEVKYTDATTNCEAKTEVTVNVHPVVNLAIAVSPGTSVCAGSEVTLTASNGASYQWAADGVDLPTETSAVLTVNPTDPVTYTASGKDANGCEATPVSATISITPAPTLALSKTTLNGCEGGAAVDLASALDKTLTSPGLTLKVKNAVGTVLSGTTVTADGTYTLYLDGGTCQSNEETVTVQFHAKPNVSFLADVSDVCSGKQVVLTASSTDDPKPTFTYGGTTNTSWTVNPTNTGNSNTPVTYTVTAKDSYGCTNTADAVVNVKPLPEVQITDPGSVCAASEVTLTASGADTYAWTGGTTPGSEAAYTVRPTLTNKQFFVTGTKDGCTNTADITLDVMDAPVLADAKPLSECVNSNVELKGAFTTGYTLSFFDENKAPLASSSVTVTTDKTYYAKATVESCSTDFKPIKVTAKSLPTVSIVGNNEICAGDETTLTANGTGIEYTWSPAGKGGTTQGTSITVDPAITMTYTVTAKGGNKCTATESLEVTVNKLPELKWDAGNPASLVAGETKTWNVGFVTEATAPYTYTWAHNDVVDNTYTNSNYSLTGTVNPEKLQVYVEDGKGCISKTIETSVSVTPQGGELTVALNAESSEICQGGMQMLTVTTGGGKAPYKYVWYKGEDEMGIADDVTTITVTDAAIYKVVVTDDGTTPQSKEASKEMKISVSLTAPAVAVADLTIPTGNSTILLPTVTPVSGSYTYQWSKVTDLKDAGQETLRNPETKILTGGTPYEVVVKDGNGCYAKASGTVHVDDVHGYKVLAAADPEKICIGNRAQLSATLSGNIPADATYEWIPATGLSAANIANPEFTSTAAGTQDYLVKVTSADGYVAVAQVAVETENKTAPTLALTPGTDVSCVGQAITVTAQGGNITDYQWTIDGRTPVNGGDTLDTLVAGNRKVKVVATAQNGCVVTPIEEDYLIHDLPTIHFDPNTPEKVDKGTELTVKAIVDGGAAGNYTYTWSPSDGTILNNTYTLNMGNSAKTFKVSVTNDATGCSSEEISKTIGVQNATPAVEITVKGENVLLCQNGISLLEVTGVKGGSGIEDDFTSYRYQWTKAGDATILSDEKSYVATTDGVYTVKVTEPLSGKSATKDITVTNSSWSAPQVANATLTIEENTQAYLFATVTGGTPDYSYYWTPLEALATSNTRVNPTTSALSASEKFTCYVTDANGCSGKGDIQVNVVEPTDPQLFTLLAKADNTNPCKGNTVQLSATPSRTLNNPTYQWTPATGLSADNIANPVFTANTAATVIYTVKVTEQGGYSRTAQVAITVKSAEAPRLELADNTGGCSGEKLTVENKNTGVTVANYHWVVNGALDNTVTGNEYPLAAGLNQTVKVYADATNGCASDTTSGVFNRKPTPVIAWNLKPTSATEEDDFTLSVTADAGVTYVWSYVFTPQGGIAQPKVDGADMNEFELVGAEKGTYVFTVYVEQDGCKSEELVHTVTVLEKGVGLAVTTDITSKEICENGSILVTATGLNGSGTYTYAWYAGTAVSGTPIATGETVMLSPTVNGQKYVVEVNDGLTTAVSLPVTLTFNSDMAPVVAGGSQNVAAGHSTILLSQVTQGTATGYHWSSPNNLLASGEETKPYPVTKPLSDNETYTYYVTDANGCISKPADVNVVVDKSANALAIEATADIVNLCRGNVSHLKVSATQGALSTDAVYEWTPSTYLAEANTATPVFTATVAGSYTYRVKVTDQGKVLVAEVEVTVKGFDAPEFAWDPANPTSYALNGKLQMNTQVTKATTGDYTYHWLKPTEQTNKIADYTVQTASKPEYDFAVVMSDKNGCQTTDTLKAHIEAETSGAQVEINAENVKVCAVPNGGTGTATLSVTKTAGPDNVTYLWEPVGNTLTLSDANMATATVEIAGKGAGPYTFKVTVADANDNTNKAEKNVILTISALPQVQIDETCLALHKDSVFVLNVANPGDYNYLWQESMYDYAQSKWQTPASKGSEKNLNGKMNEQDIRYVLVATDKSALQCKATDTAVVYRIPDAPAVEIDTNKTRLDVKLAWSSVNANDGYTVWSRKWDPYCMTSSDGGVYPEETSTTKNTWAETNMDTLEFYYVTADRNVCGNAYHSLTSDTVGYYLFDVNKQDGRSLNDNFVAVYFDFVAMGCPTTKEVFERLNIHSGNTLMYTWSYETQTTTSSTHVGSTGNSIKAFPITQGSVLQIRPSVATKFLQYGKLPNPYTFVIKNSHTDKANWNWCFMLPQKLDKVDLTILFTSDFKDINFLNRWGFNTQSDISTTNTPAYTPVGTPEAKKPLKPLIFMKVQPRKTVSADLIWK